MCVIIFKPKNKSMPSDDMITACFETNPNGAGYMYRDHGKIKILKGFMTVDHLLQSIQDTVKTVNLKKTDVCIHFRISTTGSSIPGNTHPFPLSNEISDLKALEITTDRAIAHNGILQEYSRLHNPESDLSDTMYFSKMLSGVKDRFLPLIINSHAFNSRFVLMTDKKSISFGMIKYNGLFVSNQSFQNSQIFRDERREEKQRELDIINDINTNKFQMSLYESTPDNFREYMKYQRSV